MGYRIWAEVWNDAENTMFGMADLASLSVERRLDSMGTIRLELPAHDRNAQFLQTGRVVRIYTNHPYHDKRHVVTGILQKQSLSISASGENVVWEGVDNLERVRRPTTFLGRQYNNTLITDAVNDLMSLVSGWSVAFDGVANYTNLRFDGINILQALATLAETHGYHFRLGPGANQLTFGTLGDDSGVMATSASQQAKGIESTPNLFLFDRLTLIEDSFDIYNWVIPRLGNNDTYLDIGVYFSQVGGIGGIVPNLPYSPGQLVASDRTYWYIEDTTSIASYGRRERFLDAEYLFPLTGSNAWLNASAILYTWAANWLQRHAMPQTSYRLSIAHWSDRVKVGDKIRLVHRGEVYQNGVKVRYVDIDTDLWVMKITERYTVAGVSLDLEVSTVDIYPTNPVDILVESIEKQNRRRLGPVLRPNVTTASANPTVDNTTPGELDFTLSEAALQVGKVTLTITRASASTGPDTLAVEIDGSLVAGGPFLNGSGSGLTASVDLSSYFINAPFSASHTIEVSCLYGSGTLELEVEVIEVIGSLD